MDFLTLLVLLLGLKIVTVFTDSTRSAGKRGLHFDSPSGGGGIQAKRMHPLAEYNTSESTSDVIKRALIGALALIAVPIIFWIISGFSTSARMYVVILPTVFLLIHYIYAISEAYSSAVSRKSNNITSLQTEGDAPLYFNSYETWIVDNSPSADYPYTLLSNNKNIFKDILEGDQIIIFDTSTDHNRPDGRVVIYRKSENRVVATGRTITTIRTEH